MFTGQLYPYQVEAVEQILDRRKLLVAYSMGTGKTVLTIAALEELLARGEIRTVLVLVPASLKWQWARALAKFTDMDTQALLMRGNEIVVPYQEWCAVINGTAKKRAEQWAAAREQKPDYIIASYSAVLNDWEEMCATAPDAVVLDEATVIKNFAAETSKRIKGITTDTRVALSGTPVENRPEEVFSIMEWVDRNCLGRWDLFDKSFIVRNHWGAVRSYKNLGLLHERLQTSMIRKSRLDPEVAKYLPEVAETTRPISLDLLTRRHYNFILDDLATALDELAESGQDFDLAAYYNGATSESGTSAQGKVMARLLAARMLLDHPELLMDSAEAFHEGRGEGSQYIAEFVDQISEIGQLLKRTPKLDELDRVVGDMLSEEGTKVAIFTSYRRMLPYMAARLDKHADMVLFHGQLNAVDKAGSVAKFQQDPDCRIFLSTNAGGYGLDLPEAQYLVNYDLPDSKGVLDQRNTRHVRASSEFSRVYVVNLVTENSVEERQQATLALRGKLSSAIVDGRGEGILVNDVASLTEHVAKR
jgi:SNF2 family DNA or RNA helicase